jgi:hypothetical protein
MESAQVRIRPFRFAFLVDFSGANRQPDTLCSGAMYAVPRLGADQVERVSVTPPFCSATPRCGPPCRRLQPNEAEVALLPNQENHLRERGANHIRATQSDPLLRFGDAAWVLPQAEKYLGVTASSAQLFA